MLQEGYTPREAEETIRRVGQENQELLDKYAKRMLIFQDKDRRILPIVWNRWKYYVGMRKLIKYHLKQCNNATDNVKADLKKAFERWRNQQRKIKGELQQLNLKELMEIAERTNKQVEECAATIEENQAIQDHLLI